MLCAAHERIKDGRKKLKALSSLPMSLLGSVVGPVVADPHDLKASCSLL